MSARDDVLTWARRGRPVAVNPDYVRITGDFGLGYVLSQILYWFDDTPGGECRASVESDGETWIVKRLEEFADDLGLVDVDGQPRTKVMRRHIHNLTAAGFIVAEVHHWRGGKATFIRPNWPAIGTAIRSLNLATISPSGKLPNGNLRSGKLPKRAFANAQTGKTLKETETTTETTVVASGGSGKAKGGGGAKRQRPASPSALGIGAQLYRSITNLTPNAAQREMLEAAYAAHPDRFDVVVRFWFAQGWNPKSVPGMVEVIERGTWRDGRPVLSQAPAPAAVQILDPRAIFHGDDGEPRLKPAYGVASEYELYDMDPEDQRTWPDWYAAAARAFGVKGLVQA